MNFNILKYNKKYIFGALIASLFVISTLVVSFQISRPKTTTLRPKTQATTTTNKIILSPGRITPDQNGEFTLRIKIATINAVKGQIYKITLTFPKQDLQVKTAGLNYKIGAVSTALQGDDNINIADINNRDNGQGLASINLIAEIISPPEGEIFSATAKEVATVAFKTVSDSGGTITATSDNFLKSLNSDYQVETLILEGRSSTVVPQQTPTPTSSQPNPTPTRIITPSATVAPTSTAPTPTRPPRPTDLPQCAVICPTVTKKQPGKLSATSCYVDLAWTAIGDSAYRVCRNSQCYEISGTSYRFYSPCNNSSLYKVSPVTSGCLNPACPVSAVTTPQ